jgi:hypothetical protein
MYLLLCTINVILVANLILAFPILKFDVICLLVSDVKSWNVREHPKDIRSKSIGFLMLHIYGHISIGSLAVWLDWMPLSECTTTERDWMSLNILWVRVNVCMRVLNMLECTLRACECLWVSMECGWMHLSVRDTFEWVWTWLNALIYWFLHENECAWTSLSEWEYDWMRLNVLWVHMNTFEQVLNVLECTLSACEHLWASIECDWMPLNALECTWMPLSEYWTYISVHLYRKSRCIRPHGL